VAAGAARAAAGCGLWRRDRRRPARCCGCWGSEITTIAGLLLYLYVAEPAVSHIAAFRSWTVYLPGVAADGLTQAVQAGVRLLPAWQGGLAFAAWAAVIALAGIAAAVRRDIT
jgi:ABC-2 type transport system permease protein